MGSCIPLIGLYTPEYIRLAAGCELIYSINCPICSLFFFYCSWLYWTHYGARAIYKGATDGSSSSVLHGNLHNPYAITLDHSSDRLFWSEQTTIKSSLTDGSNLMTLMTLHSVYGLSVFEGILYVAKWNPSEARAVFVNSTDMTRTLTTAIRSPIKIEVVSLFKQPLGKYVTSLPAPILPFLPA